jgi:mRNA-degrading endonuclease RelE of RelBE toxin-antitoxin system
MTYRVFRSRSFDRDVDDFARYATEYSEPFAREQFVRLEKVLSIDLVQSPNTWSYFFVTGAPNRAYFFSVGRRTGFWIIYTVDEDLKRVDLLRFWNASRDTHSFNANP